MKHIYTLLLNDPALGFDGMQDEQSDIKFFIMLIEYPV
jgi:hypothetical protein